MTRLKDLIVHKPLCNSTLARECSCGVGEAIDELAALTARLQEAERLLTEYEVGLEGNDCFFCDGLFGEHEERCRHAAFLAAK
jgi:hypothetical protein